MIDLHLHTTYSDGSNTVKEVFEIAQRSNISTISITDHDDLKSIKEGNLYSKEFNVNFIPGVELSTLFDDMEVHILGYFIDENNVELNDKIKFLLNSRDQRNYVMIKRLNDLGYKITEEEFFNVTVDSKNIGRPHAAKILMNKGYFKSINEVFEKLLSRGMPGYVDRDFLTPTDAIKLIHNAGGIAVLAHPFNYYNKERIKVKYFIEYLAVNGLDGVEVYYVTFNYSQMDYLKNLCNTLKLLKTGGSDYHGTFKPTISMGKGLGNLYVDESVYKNMLKYIKK